MSTAHFKWAKTNNKQAQCKGALIINVIFNQQNKVSQKLARNIADRIIASGWAVGANLGTEPQLLASHHVSREPFREAVRILELQGIAHMQRGPGGGLVVSAPAETGITCLIRAYLGLIGIGHEQVLDARLAITHYAIDRVIQRVQNGELSDIGKVLQLRDLPKDVAWTAMLGPAFGMLWQIDDLADRPGLAIFHKALAQITVDYGRFYAMPEPVCRAAVPRFHRCVRQLVAALVDGDALQAKLCITAMIENASSAVRRLEKRDANVWTPCEMRVDHTSDNELFVGRIASKRAEVISAHMLRDIRARQLQPGALFGSEIDLIPTYNVSRAVFRESVRLLEFFGMLQARRGKFGGLIVAPPSPESTIQAAAVYLNYLQIADAKLIDCQRWICGVLVEFPGNRALQLFSDMLTRTLSSRGALDPEPRVAAS